VLALLGGRKARTPTKRGSTSGVRCVWSLLKVYSQNLSVKSPRTGSGCGGCGTFQGKPSGASSSAEHLL
jgi:hypothetical protein